MKASALHHLTASALHNSISITALALLHMTACMQCRWDTDWRPLAAQRGQASALCHVSLQSDTTWNGTAQKGFPRVYQPFWWCVFVKNSKRIAHLIRASQLSNHGVRLASACLAICKYGGIIARQEVLHNRVASHCSTHHHLSLPCMRCARSCNVWCSQVKVGPLHWWCSEQACLKGAALHAPDACWLSLRFY